MGPNFSITVIFTFSDLSTGHKYTTLVKEPHNNKDKGQIVLILLIML